MAKRFGRNQKRKMRVKIEELEADLVREVREKHAAQRTKEMAMNEGMRRVMNDDRFSISKVEMADKLIRCIAPELEQAARKLMRSMEKNHTPILPTFDAKFDPLASVETVTVSGVIPSTHYHIELARY